MPKTSEHHHLFRPHQTWNFRYRWPTAVRSNPAFKKAIGKHEFVRSLKTTSLDVAQRQRGVLLAHCKGLTQTIREGSEREIKDELAKWLNQFGDPDEIATKERLKKQWAGSKARPDYRSEVLEDKIFDEGIKQYVPDGIEAGAYPDQDAVLKAYPAVQKYIEEITNPFDTYLQEFLEERRSKINERTLEDFELSISRFSKNFKTVGSVNTRDVRDWFRGLEKKLSTSRIRSINQHLHAYWIFLSEKEIVPDDVDPFKSIRLIEAKKTKGYEPFEVDDCVMLLDAAERKPDSQLADLILLVLYTGMRIEEACSLKTKDVKPDRLIITEGKTLAAEREIPIHSKFKPLLNVMIAESKDGYVISGITSKERHGKRHCAVGQRFGRMKDRLEFKKKYQCFHSFRKTVTTLLQQAGVDISVAADILGHQNPHFTWRVYSSGSSMQQKQDAIEKLEYPPLPELTKRRLDRIVPLSN